jgi:hypothetical protein
MYTPSVSHYIAYKSKSYFVKFDQLNNMKYPTFIVSDVYYMKVFHGGSNNIDLTMLIFFHLYFVKL